jgi:hypothetical protein
VAAAAVGAGDAVPVQVGRPGDGVDRLALGVGRLGREQADVH